MKTHSRKAISVLLVLLLMIAAMTSCSSQGNSSVTSGKTTVSGSTATTKSENPGVKTDLVMMITQVNDLDQQLENLITEKFKDKYNIVFKTWEETNVEQTVKTAALGGAQIDLVKYWPNSMESFLSADMASDLTAVMDAGWKACFTDPDILQMGTYGGKLYNIPCCMRLISI